MKQYSTMEVLEKSYDEVSQKLYHMKKELARKEKKLQRCRRTHRAREHVQRKLREQSLVSSPEFSHNALPLQTSLCAVSSVTPVLTSGCFNFSVREVPPASCPSKLHYCSQQTRNPTANFCHHKKKQTSHTSNRNTGPFRPKLSECFSNSSDTDCLFNNSRQSGEEHVSVHSHNTDCEGEKTSSCFTSNTQTCSIGTSSCFTSNTQTCSIGMNHSSAESLRGQSSQVKHILCSSDVTPITVKSQREELSKTSQVVKVGSRNEIVGESRKQNHITISPDLLEDFPILRAKVAAEDCCNQWLENSLVLTPADGRCSSHLDVNTMKGQMLLGLSEVKLKLDLDCDIDSRSVSSKSVEARKNENHGGCEHTKQGGVTDYHVCELTGQGGITDEHRCEVTEQGGITDEHRCEVTEQGGITAGEGSQEETKAYECSAILLKKRKVEISECNQNGKRVRKNSSQTNNSTLSNTEDGSCGSFVVCASLKPKPDKIDNDLSPVESSLEPNQDKIDNDLSPVESSLEPNRNKIDNDLSPVESSDGLLPTGNLIHLNQSDLHVQAYPGIKVDSVTDVSGDFLKKKIKMAPEKQTGQQNARGKELSSRAPSNKETDTTSFLDFTELDVIPFSQFQYSEGLFAGEDILANGLKGSKRRRSHFGILVQRRSPRLSAGLKNLVGDDVDTQSCVASDSSTSCSSQAPLPQSDIKPEKTQRKTRKGIMISSVFQFIVDEARRIRDVKDFILPMHFIEGGQKANLVSSSKSLTSSTPESICSSTNDSFRIHCHQNMIKVTSSPSLFPPPDAPQKVSSPVSALFQSQDAPQKVSSPVSVLFPSSDAPQKMSSPVSASKASPIGAADLPEEADCGVLEVSLCVGEALLQKTDVDLVLTDNLTTCVTQKKVNPLTVDNLTSCAGQIKTDLLTDNYKPIAYFGQTRTPVLNEDSVETEKKLASCVSEADVVDLETEKKLASCVSEADIVDLETEDRKLVSVDSFQTGKQEPVVAVLCGVLHTAESLVDFVVTMTSSSLAVWSCEDCHWSNQLDWILPGGCSLSRAWLLPSDDKVVVLMLGTNLSNPISVSVIAYDWLSGHSTRFNVPISQSQACPLSEGICCPVAPYEICVFYRQPPVTSGFKVHLNASFNAVVNDVSMDSITESLLSVGCVQSPSQTIVGLTDSSIIYMWNHNTGLLLQAVDISSCASMPLSLGPVLTEKGYMLLTVLSYTDPVRVIAVNPSTGCNCELLQFDTVQGLTSVQACDQLGDVLIMCDSTGSLVLWEVCTGKLLMKTENQFVQSFAVDASQERIFAGQKQGCVHIYQVQ